MNGQIKYIIQGALLVVLVIIIINAIHFLYSSTLSVTKKIVTDSVTIRPKVYTITNIEGQKLFSENCSACHALLKHDGGQLFGIEERVKDKALLHEWIRNSSKVLRSGNSYFNEVTKENGDVRMSDFPNLTDKQIDDILEYIKQVDLVRHQ